MISTVALAAGGLEMQKSHVTQLPDIEPLKIRHPKIQAFLIILKLQVGDFATRLQDTAGTQKI